MKEISTLIWSEWRRQRKTALFMLFITIFFYAFIAMFIELKLFLSAIPVVSGVLVVGLPVLYALALGDSFASEFTNKSNSFLLGLPISKTKIYFVKYFSSTSLFLAISIVGSLLMYTHSNFYKSASVKLFTGMIFFLLSVWLLVHVAIFLCNLITRNSNNGVIMLLILPVLLIILAPGIFIVNMFFFTSDASWFIASIFSSILTLYAIILISGWCLWDRRISQGRKIWGAIVKTLFIMCTFSLFLYFCTDMYTKYQYEIYEKNINLNKFHYKFKDTSSTRYNIIKFHKYREQHPSSKMHIYQYMARRAGTNIWPYLKDGQNDNTKFMLDDVAVKKMYLILNKQKQTKYIYSHINIDYNTKIAVIFLIDLAYTQARAGKYTAFFKSLKLAEKYCVFLKRIESKYSPSNASLLLRLVYLTMIKLGPEGTNYTKNYQEALRFIQGNHTYCPPYTSTYLLYRAIGSANPRSTSNYLNKIYYRLRARQGLISWMKYIAKCKNLYQEAEKTCDLQDIIKKNKKLIHDSKKVVGYCKMLALKEGRGLNSYFLARYKFIGDKLCLALKIFRCRYGRYPRKLQELCPEILKKIPLIPIVQKAYKYKRNTNGFILNGRERKIKYNFLYYKMDYKPYEEKNK